MRLVFRAWNRWEWDDIGLLVGEQNSEGKIVTVAKPLEFAPRDPNSLIVGGPTASMYHESAQQLMDALWECGIRPKSGEGNAGQLGATERHLADMRRLVFKDGGES